MKKEQFRSEDLSIARQFSQCSRGAVAMVESWMKGVRIEDQEKEINKRFMEELKRWGINTQTKLLKEKNE